MPKKFVNFLWVFAGVAAFMLSFLTLRLARFSDSQTALIGEQVYFVGNSTLVMLREHPISSAQVRGVAERGSVGTIIEMQAGTQQNWFWVETPKGSGWVGSENLALDSP